MLRRFFSQHSDHSELSVRVQTIALNDAIARAAIFCMILAVAFFSYGFMSLGFIRVFRPETTLWSNFWPRIVFNVLPILAVFGFLKIKEVSGKVKLFVFVSGVTATIQAAAWVFVWPIALAGKSEVLLFVNAANVYLVSFLYMVVAPPNRFLFGFTTVLLLGFILPLFAVAYLSGNEAILNLILNDTMFTLCSGVVLSSVIQSLRTKLTRLELERAQSAKSFLNHAVARTIYEGRTDLLEKRKQKGFVLSVDMRGYTSLVQKHPEKSVAEFMENYHEWVSQLVERFGGHVHKTAGDGHLITFGLLDDQKDLSDIPGIEGELAAAEQRRFSDLMANASSCAFEIIKQAHRLAIDSGLGDAIRIGAAIDFGEVEIKVVGDQHRKELDVFGPVIIRAARLEAHTKTLATRFPPTSSILILSPDAGEFLAEGGGFYLMKTDGVPVRDFPELKFLYTKDFNPAAAAMARGREAA